MESIFAWIGALCVVVLLLIILFAVIDNYLSTKRQHAHIAREKEKNTIVREIGVELLNGAYWLHDYPEAEGFCRRLGTRMAERGYVPSFGHLRDGLDTERKARLEVISRGEQR